MTLSKVRDFQSASMRQVQQSNREPNQLGSYFVKLDTQTITVLKWEKDKMFVKMRFFDCVRRACPALEPSRPRARVSDLRPEPSLRCLISDRLD